MATKSISQLDTAIAVSNDDLFETAVPDNGSATGYSSKKHSMAAVADHAANAVVYPALQTTAKTLVGAINEAAQGGGGGSAMHNYSTTEQVVGTWVDGSTVYEKTINIGELPNASTKNVAHNISNLSLVISIVGGAKDVATFYPMPLVQQGNFLNYQVRVVVNATNVQVQTSEDLRSVTDSYVTIRYIKSA